MTARVDFISRPSMPGGGYYVASEDGMESSQLAASMNNSLKSGATAAPTTDNRPTGLGYTAGEISDRTNTNMQYNNYTGAYEDTEQPVATQQAATPAVLPTTPAVLPTTPVEPAYQSAQVSDIDYWSGSSSGEVSSDDMVSWRNPVTGETTSQPSSINPPEGSAWEKGAYSRQESEDVINKYIRNMPRGTGTNYQEYKIPEPTNPFGNPKAGFPLMPSPEEGPGFDNKLFDKKAFDGSFQSGPIGDNFNVEPAVLPSNNNPMVDVGNQQRFRPVGGSIDQAPNQTPSLRAQSNLDRINQELSDLYAENPPNPGAIENKKIQQQQAAAAAMGEGQKDLVRTAVSRPEELATKTAVAKICLLYTSPSPRD